MTTDNRNPRTGNNSLTIALALISGAGFVSMMIALAVGVSGGTAADGELVGLMFVGGLITFAAGVMSWAAVIRPWENFDDINVPQFHGHHHDHAEDHKEEASEH